jgi:two-component system, chemotaxis family, CheB/CheR fusion protein
VNPSNAKTVLYVEDNAVNAYLVQAIFAEHAGVQLMTATSGTAGLDFARKQPPDLILLDLNLPDMDGAEFLSKLRAVEAHAAIPVIIVSADAIDDQRTRALRLKVADYVTKPFDVAHFERIVEQHLKK